MEKKEKRKYYCVVRWQVEDVEDILERRGLKWSREQIVDFLEKNEKGIISVLTEYGWEVLENLI